MLRHLLRRLSRNRLLVKRLPDALGRGLVHCSPEATLSVWKPGWKGTQGEQLFQWAQRYLSPGMVVWDIGANQGLFCLAASAVVGPNGSVMAFEPDIFLGWLLERSLETGTHRGAEVMVLPVAISDRLGTAKFLIAKTDRTLNHLVAAKGNPHTGGARRLKPVMTATIDWLAQEFGPPDLIKIDVEGAEITALEGAANVLNTKRPKVIIEVAPENTGRIAEIFKEHRYSMYDASTKSARLEILKTPAWNTLAVPAEAQAPD